MSHEYKISAHRKVGEWLEGKIDGFLFQAKVYDIGSQYGIDNGRVSKLTIWAADRHPGDAIINYDRGWDKSPSEGWQQELLQALLAYLEAFLVRNMGG